MVKVPDTYRPVLGSITRGRDWNFTSVFNPNEYAQIKGWDGPGYWTPRQAREFEAWDGHFSGTMHGPFAADDFAGGIEQLPGGTELEMHGGTARGRSLTVESPYVAYYGQTATEEVIRRSRELAAKNLALRERQLRLNEAWSLTADQLKGTVTAVPQTSATKPDELWNIKSTQNPTEYALLKRWDIDAEIGRAHV